eukprot:9512090-Alexandrium_andersonii.AAC.1
MRRSAMLDLDAAPMSRSSTSTRRLRTTSSASGWRGTKLKHWCLISRLGPAPSSSPVQRTCAHFRMHRNWKRGRPGVVTRMTPW